MNTILRNHIRTGFLTNLARVRRTCYKMTERIEQLHQSHMVDEAKEMDAVEAAAMEAEEILDMVPPNEESNS